MHPGLENIVANINSSKKLTFSDMVIDNILSFIIEHESLIVSISVYESIMLIQTKLDLVFTFNIKDHLNSVVLENITEENLNALYMVSPMTNGLNKIKDYVEDKKMKVNVKYSYRFRAKVDYRGSDRFSDKGGLMYLITVRGNIVDIEFFHKYKIRG